MRISSDKTPKKTMRIADLRKPIEEPKSKEKNVMLMDVVHDGVPYDKGQKIEDAALIAVFKEKGFIS